MANYSLAQLLQRNVDTTIDALNEAPVSSSKAQNLNKSKVDALATDADRTKANWTPDTLTGMTDADTPYLKSQEIDGERRKSTREVTAPNAYDYDAIEGYHYLYNKNKDGTYDITTERSNTPKEEIAKSRWKTGQLQQVADIVGKPIDQVTNQDLSDVSNMQTIQKLSDLARTKEDAGTERWMAPFIPNAEPVNLTGNTVDEYGQKQYIPLDIPIQSNLYQGLASGSNRSMASLGNNAGENVTQEHAIDPRMNLTPDKARNNIPGSEVNNAGSMSGYTDEQLRQMQLKDTVQSSSRVGNLVDALQFGVGRTAAEFGDAIVDAGIRIGKNIDEVYNPNRTEAERNAILDKELKGYVKNGDFIWADKYKTPQEYGYDNTRTNLATEDLGKSYDKMIENPNTENIMNAAGSLVKGMITAGPEWAAESAVYMIATRNPVGMAITTIGMANESMSEVQKNTSKSDIGYLKRLQAGVGAALQMGLEKIGVDELIGNTNYVQKLIGNVIENGTEKSAKALVKTFAQKALKVSGKAGYEGITETAQQIVQSFSEKFGTNAEKELYDGTLGREMFQSFGAAMGPGAIISGGAEVIPAVKDMNDKKKKNAQEDKIANMNQEEREKYNEEQAQAAINTPTIEEDDNLQMSNLGNQTRKDIYDMESIGQTDPLEGFKKSRELKQKIVAMEDGPEKDALLRIKNRVDNSVTMPYVAEAAYNTAHGDYEEINKILKGATPRETDNIIRKAMLGMGTREELKSIDTDEFKSFALKNGMKEEEYNNSVEMAKKYVGLREDMRQVGKRVEVDGFKRENRLGYIDYYKNMMESETEDEKNKWKSEMHRFAGVQQDKTNKLIAAQEEAKSVVNDNIVAFAKAAQIPYKNALQIAMAEEHRLKPYEYMKITKSKNPKIQNAIDIYKSNHALSKDSMIKTQYSNQDIYGKNQGEFQLNARETLTDLAHDQLGSDYVSQNGTITIGDMKIAQEEGKISPDLDLSSELYSTDKKQSTANKKEATRQMMAAGIGASNSSVQNVINALKEEQDLMLSAVNHDKLDISNKEDNDAKKEVSPQNQGYKYEGRTTAQESNPMLEEMEGDTTGMIPRASGSEVINQDTKSDTKSDINTEIKDEANNDTETETKTKPTEEPKVELSKAEERIKEINELEKKIEKEHEVIRKTLESKNTQIDSLLEDAQKIYERLNSKEAKSEFKEKQKKLSDEYKAEIKKLEKEKIKLKSIKNQAKKAMLKWDNHTKRMMKGFNQEKANEINDESKSINTLADRITQLGKKLGKEIYAHLNDLLTKDGRYKAWKAFTDKAGQLRNILKKAKAQQKIVDEINARIKDIQQKQATINSKRAMDYARQKANKNTRDAIQKSKPKLFKTRDKMIKRVKELKAEIGKVYKTQDLIDSQKTTGLNSVVINNYGDAQKTMSVREKDKNGQYIKDKNGNYIRTTRNIYIPDMITTKEGKSKSSLGSINIAEHGENSMIWSESVITGNNLLQSIPAPRITPNKDVKIQDPKFALYDNPAIALLYNASGDLNWNVVGAIATVTQDILANNMSRIQMARPKDIASYYGINEENITADIMETLGQGIPLKYFTNSAGESIMKQLGIIQNPNGKNADYIAIKQGLGEMVFQNMRALGKIKQHSQSSVNAKYIAQLQGKSKKEIDAINKDASMPMVKISDEYNMIGETKLAKRKLERLDTEVGVDKMIKTYRTKKKDMTNHVSKVKNNPHSDVYPAMQESVNKQTNQEYNIDMNGMQNLMEIGKEKALEIMGWKNVDQMKKSKKYSHDTIEAQKGKNFQLENEWNGLEEVYQKIESGEIDNEIYFDWFVSKTNRMFLDGNILDPQSQKHIQRWLVTGKESYAEADMSNNEHREAFLYGIGQAFGIKVDGIETKKREELAEQILDIPAKKLRSTVMSAIKSGEKSIGIKHNNEIVKIKVDHLGHIMSALNAVQAYQMQEDGKFNTNLVLEVDGKTNGFAIKVAQGMVEDEDGEWQKRVGIVDADAEPGMSTNDILSRPGQLDSYEGLAQKLLAIKDIIANGKAWIKKRRAEGLENGDTEEYEGFEKQLDALIPYIPGSDVVEEKIVDEIDSSMRELLKDPFMTFNYSAGMNSIIKSLARVMMKNVPDDIVNESKQGKIIMNSLGIPESHHNEYREFLRNNSIDSDKSNLSYPLAERLELIVRSTYGEAITEILESELGQAAEYSNQMNDASKYQMRMYMEVLEMEIGKGGNISIAQLEKITNRPEIRAIFPIVAGPLSTSREDGVAIFNSMIKSREDMRDVNVKLIGEEQASINIQSIERTLAEAMSAAAVGLTQTIDGANMAMTINENDGINPVFDAAVGGVTNMHSAVRSLNKWFSVLNSQYNMYEASKNALKESIIAHSEYMQKHGTHEQKINPLAKINSDNAKDNLKSTGGKKIFWIDDSGKKVKWKSKSVAKHLSIMEESSKEIQGNRDNMAKQNLNVMQFVFTENTGYKTKGTQVDGKQKEDIIQKLAKSKNINLAKKCGE